MYSLECSVTAAVAGERDAANSPVASSMANEVGTDGGLLAVETRCSIRNTQLTQVTRVD